MIGEGIVVATIWEESWANGVFGVFFDLCFFFALPFCESFLLLPVFLLFCERCE